MGTPFDVALGRLVAAQGLVAADVVRRCYDALPPGRSLAEDLVARRLIDAAVARALVVQDQAASGGRATGSPAASEAQADLTVRLTTGAPETVAAPAALEARPPPGAAKLLAEGDVVGGRYEVLGVLGKGGMGAVYRARDRESGEELALKVMLAQADGDGEALARFQREAEVMARVDAHPGIVRIRAAGLHAGDQPYAAMDLISGRDLHAMVKAGARCRSPRRCAWARPCAAPSITATRAA
jgi:hypothetical protein